MEICMYPTQLTSLVVTLAISLVLVVLTYQAILNRRN